MPQRNGTGPLGLGAMTGRGHGGCMAMEDVKQSYGLGCGLGRRKGFDRGFYDGNGIQASSKELLEGQKAVFEKRIAVINNQLKNL